MRNGLLALLLTSALALAGCSGDSGGHTEFTEVACPDGTILSAQDIEADEAHHAEGFDPASLCPEPPQVLVSGLPASVQVYRNAAFTWVVDPGSVARGHSMLTEIRYATASVPDADASTTTYGKTIIKKEHQDLPVTFKGNMTFNTAGKVYVRAYAQVQGEGYDRREIWGPELVLDVTPVVATGTTVTVTHALGPVEDLSASQSEAVLGDAVSFDNDDLLPHNLVLDSAPAGAAACTLEAAAQAAAATTCLLAVPGSYVFETTGDAQAKTVTINVKAQ